MELGDLRRKVQTDERTSQREARGLSEKEITENVAVLESNRVSLGSSMSIDAGQANRLGAPQLLR